MLQSDSVISSDVPVALQAPAGAAGRGPASRDWQALLADMNFGSDRILAENTDPRPVNLGLGSGYPCWRTQVTYFTIAARNEALEADPAGLRPPQA